MAIASLAAKELPKETPLGEAEEQKLAFQVGLPGETETPT